VTRDSASTPSPGSPVRIGTEAVLTASLVALVLAGCAVDGRLPGDAIVVGTSQDLGTVNELISASTAFNAEIVSHLFLKLLVEQPDFEDSPPTFTPSLATSYELSADRRTLTFHLRPDAVWSDGVPITAEDVRFTWQAQTHPAVAWDWSFAKGAITDVEVMGPHTVRFHFDEVSASQLMDANEGGILPKHAWEKLPFEEWRENANWFLDNLVTSGPYTVGRWSRQVQLELHANPRYLDDGLPRTPRILFRFVPDQPQLVAQLLGGDLDMISNVEAADAERIETNPGTRLISFPSSQFTFVAWNLRRPQFRAVEVRRALAMATDRQAIVEVIWKGYARVSSSPIISGVWAHNEAIEPWPYDPEAARRLLEGAGWMDRDGDGVRERNGTELSFDLVTIPGNRGREDAALLIQDNLRAVGVEVHQRRLELDTLIGRALEHEFDALISAFLIGTDLDLEYAFHTRAIDNGHNWTGYSNSEVDRLIDEVNRETDLGAARERLLRIQEILHRDQPFLFLWEPLRLVGVSTRLDNVHPNRLSNFANLPEWSVRAP
jgi:peptide/nickel transport system substrate-binding protein